SRVFPARLHAAGGAEQAGTIVRSREPPIIHDPAQNVGAAKIEIYRAEAAQAHGIVGASVDPADLQAADVRLAVIDIAVAEPQRAVRIAVDTAAKYGIAAGDAAIDDGLRADLRDGALQRDVPPVDRCVESAQGTGLEDDPD